MYSRIESPLNAVPSTRKEVWGEVILLLITVWELLHYQQLLKEYTYLLSNVNKGGRELGSSVGVTVSVRKYSGLGGFLLAESKNVDDASIPSVFRINNAINHPSSLLPPAFYNAIPFHTADHTITITINTILTIPRVAISDSFLY